MLYLHDLHNVDSISMHVVKSSYQTSRPSRVETQEDVLPT